MTESKGGRFAAEAIYKYIYILCYSTFYSWRSFIANTKIVFPVANSKNVTLHIILDQPNMSSAKTKKERSQLLAKVKNTRVLTGAWQNNQTTEMTNHYIFIA